MTTRLVAILLALAFAAQVQAQDLSTASAKAEWPEFRGPGAQGHSTEQGLPLEWSETKNIAWKTPVAGLGWSSPVVANGRVWLTTAVEQRGISLRAIAFDAATGKEVVNVEVFKIPTDRRDINPKNSWASPSPVIEGDRVYVHFGADGTAALSLSGEIIWKNRFEYQSQHGAGGSPIVYRDMLIFSCDGSDAAFVIALDKLTGKELWRADHPEMDTWATPLVVTHAGRQQVIVNAMNRVRSYDLETGNIVWAGPGTTMNVIPSPVFGNGMVFIMSGFRGNNLKAIKLADAKGDISTTGAIAWQLDRDTPYVPSPLLYDNILYFLKTNNGLVSAFDAATGKPHYQVQRIAKAPGEVFSSPVGADGRVYITSRDGITTVIKHGPTYEVLAENTLDDGFDASMALAGNEIFLRGYKYLYAIGQ